MCNHISYKYRPYVISSCICCEEFEEISVWKTYDLNPIHLSIYNPVCTGVVYTGEAQLSWF